MKYYKSIAVVLGLLAASSAGALQAQTVNQNPGAYVQASVGSGVAGNTHIDASASGIGSASGDLDPKAGVFASGAWGYAFKNGFALEAEGVYVRNDISTGSLNQALGTPAKASVETYGGLVDVMYAIGKLGPVVPYAGLGVGYGQARYSLLGGSSSSDGVMWQARAGVSYPVNPKTSLDFGYRYLGTPQFKITGSGLALKAQTDLHILSVGLRYRY
ncbi:outer membrane protein [Phenylobacterium montanum]|uniref:Porin family protein n=1 Tax=Phenylobacterium montanum TaxID=2823693 RepID=A0A975FZJ9_9CAUL|nr:outer membrane beta-barrel protein [Caulobacter sp. S6]QUD88165.1 porin family protein [Caulobacter sp. S6]